MRRIAAVICVSVILLSGCSKDVEEPPITETEATTAELVPESYNVAPSMYEAEIKTPYEPSVGDLYKVETEVGYTFYAVRPMGHDRTLEQYDGLPTIQQTLSGEYWSGDQVVHRHQVAGLEEESGFYVEDNCWIEESVTVQVYPVDGLDKGWVYENGEDFSDWLDQQAQNLAWGDDSQLLKQTYMVEGAEWTVYYGQRNLNEDPKENFSSVECMGYKVEDNGDYVVVTLKHDNFPTIRNDEHVPSNEERLATAMESMESVITTLRRE